MKHFIVLAALVAVCIAQDAAATNGGGLFNFRLPEFKWPDFGSMLGGIFRGSGGEAQADASAPVPASVAAPGGAAGGLPIGHFGPALPLNNLDYLVDNSGNIKYSVSYASKPADPSANQWRVVETWGSKIMEILLGALAKNLANGITGGSS